MDPVFDVIIVGGRPAGASLAARLGEKNLSVLLVDKATFPSNPEVPSNPILYPSAMVLLEEIGLTEDQYEHATTKIEKGVIHFEPYFKTTLDVPVLWGRRYVRGLDRRIFDELIWRNVEKYPSVTRISGFSVKGLLRDEQGKVTGVEGASGDGNTQQFKARLCVVGADGRHSFIARQVQAKVIKEQMEHTSTAHFAEWEGLTPALSDGSPVIQIVTAARGRSILFFPSANGKVSVTVYVRSALAETAGDVERYYQENLNAFAEVRRRLQGAKRVSPLLGMKRIANRYLQPVGEGWVLVGDATHHKDPVDGQGIYDALVEAKRLAALLVSLHQKQLSWSELAVKYPLAIQEETGDMFDETMKRIQRELYEEPPAFIIKTAMKWLMQDPQYHERFFHFLGRDIPPKGWLSPSLVAGCLLRGMFSNRDRASQR